MENLADKAHLMAISEDRMEKLRADIFLFNEKLKHLPYSKLKKGGHVMGCLRGWIKYKSLVDPQCWDELKWRPLVSYRNHRWRRVLSLVSQW